MTIINEIIGFLTDPLMQRSLLAAVIVGLVAPVMGTYLVQRRLALLGDGIGHVALTGVALGWIVGAAMGLVERDALAIPGAVFAAVIGAVAIEFVRERGRTNGDIALALMFYAGIAGGVVLIGIAGGTNANLMGYLFGSISTVSQLDLILIAGLGLVILLIGFGMRGLLFAVSHDEEFARASGLPVRAANIIIAVIAALTVTVAMRVVGLLLVSAIMILPVAVAQPANGSSAAFISLLSFWFMSSVAIFFFHPAQIRVAQKLFNANRIFGIVGTVLAFKHRHATDGSLDARLAVQLNKVAGLHCQQLLDGGISTR